MITTNSIEGSITQLNVGTCMENCIRKKLWIFYFKLHFKNREKKVIFKKMQLEK